MRSSGRREVMAEDGSRERPAGLCRADGGGEGEKEAGFIDAEKEKHKMGKG